MSRTRLASLVLTFVALVSACGSAVTATPAAAKVQRAATSYCVPTGHTTNVTPNATYTDYFKQSGPGWVAGDAAYSAKVPDGRTVWTFSDTLIGSQKSDGTFGFTGMPHNTMMVGTGANLKSLYSGDYSAPRSLIPDTTVNGQPAWWYVNATYTEGSSLLVYVTQFTGQPGDYFATFTGVSKIAIFSLPATSSAVPQLQGMVTIANDQTTQWGNGYTHDATYNYIYGLNDHKMKVARVLRGSSTNAAAWRYWNGTSWVSGEANAAIVNTTQAEAVSPLPGNWGKGYIAVGVSPFPGNSLTQQFACSPQGPWSAPETVYTTPETAWPPPDGYHNVFAYIPTVAALGTSSLVIMYNVNTSDGFSAVAQNPNQYRPKGVTFQ